MTIEYTSNDEEVRAVTTIEAYASSGPPRSSAVRIGALLGLKRAEELDDLSLADRVAKGLAPSAAVAIARVLGAERVVGPIVPEATLRRARVGRRSLSREHSERLYEIGRVLDELARVYHGDVASIVGFLTQPHPLLDGRTPFDLARSSSAGSDAVLRLIERADAGVPV